MNILSKMLNALCGQDYVVEQGKSGNWHYRKYNNGFAQCWGTQVISVIIDNTSASYGGYRSDTIYSSNFPFAFTETPSVMVGIKDGSHGAWVTHCGGTSGTRIGFMLSAGTKGSSATNRTMHFVAEGKWK